VGTRLAGDPTRESLAISWKRFAMRRVARRRVVILTWDVAAGDSFWLTAHYFPEITAFDSTRFTPIDELASLLGGQW
jgi:hypothetical protein